MPAHRNLAYPRQRGGIAQDALGIFYLIQYGHIIKFSLALAMAIEVESDHGNAFLVEAVCEAVEEFSLLVAAKSMAEHEERSLLASLRFGICLASVASVIVWALDDYIEFAMVALYGGMLS